jgi:hypothetical protein
MDKIDKRYQNGKIYTVRCKYDDDLIYVGSTIQPLCMRMGGHRRHKTCSLYQHVSGDWDNWYIELYEEFPCNNKTILEKREGEITRQIGTVNKRIAGRTDKQYYEDNTNKIKEQHKKYYESNKELIKQYQKDNANKIAERKKENYEINKEKILDKMKEKVECDKCKSILSRGDLTRHKKSKVIIRYNG